MRIRAYYYNMVKDGKVLGSVKCENATQAKAITAIILGVDPESLSTRRVSAVVAAPPVELYKKPEENTTHEEEKSSTGDTSPKRQVIVDFSKSSKNEGQPNAKQMAAWAQLKHEVADSDSVSLNSIESVWYVDSNGLMQVSFSYFLNTTIMRVREVIIGRGGAVHGYGRKPRGTEKLLTVKKDVLKYCYKDEKISLQ
jgi:hypothetical protein